MTPTDGADANGHAEPAVSDALAHFWNAAHELLKAARVVLDAADELVEEQLRAKPEPQTVNFAFVDLRGGTVTYTTYEWDLDGDGTFDATGQTTSRTYPNDGVFDITLRVTDSTGATSTLTKKAYIVITNKVCIVPDFGNQKQNRAQGLWSDAGFTTQVQFAPGSPNGNWTINTQTLTGGFIDPPGGCGATITVGP